jgi:hypothetical protein
VPTKEQHSWLQTALGVVGGLTQSAKDAVTSVEGTVVAGAKAIVAGANTVENTVVAGAKAVGEVVGKGVKAVEDGVVAAESAVYETAMKSLDAEIQHVADAGLDKSHYAAQAKSIRDGYADALKVGDGAARVAAIGALVLRANQAASDAKEDVARVTKSSVEGVGAAVTDMRDGAKKLIDKLPKDSKEKPELAKRLTELDASIAEAGKVTERAARARRLKQVNVAAESLFDDAAAASKDSETVQAVYSKALKSRYGFDVANPSGMKNTHLDQVYKMFDKVPETDVVQGKLKTLTYQPLDDKGGQNTGAAYGDAVIEMGDYGTEDWAYNDPKTGKATPANGFSISTLHELGHSVDDRFGIMAATQAKSGGGGWRKEPVKSVAQAFIGEFRSGSGKSLKIDDKQLAGLVEGALSGAGVKRPDKMSDAAWAVLQPLLNLCATRRSDSSTWPWSAPHDIGGRTYHEAYKDEWWSYETAVRAKGLTVRDYQWRAPGEWFAELYAYSYYNSKPPPGGVDAAIAAYMYGGKSSGAGAPSAAH